MTGFANGNFGPGTKSALQNQALVSMGTADTTHNWVRLFQGALRFNGYSASFSGTFDTATRNAASAFQSYAELATIGGGNYQTWHLSSSVLETKPDWGSPATWQRK